jgi:hypothetical protein
MGIRCADHVTHYRLNLALISPKSGGRSIGIVRLRTKTTENVIHQNECDLYRSKSNHPGQELQMCSCRYFINFPRRYWRNEDGVTTSYLYLASDVNLAMPVKTFPIPVITLCCWYPSLSWLRSSPGLLPREATHTAKGAAGEVSLVTERCVLGGQPAGHPPQPPILRTTGTNKTFE